MTTSATLPEVLRTLLIAVREGLKRAGDDGSAGSRNALVDVKMGWAEVRAVYYLCAGVEATRRKNNLLKKKCAALSKDLARHRADITDHNLVNDRAVLHLLAEASLIASGSNIHEQEIRDIRDRIDTFLARAKKADRRREERARPTI